MHSTLFVLTYRFIALWILVCLPATTFAQVDVGFSADQYVSESWGLDNGLPIGHINQIYQTPDGYLWMATFSGLLRFDGIKFTRFDVSNTPGLPSNRLVMIWPGQDSSFWLFTEQRTLVRVSEGVFKSFGTLLDIENQRVILDGDSITWVTSRKGILRLEGDELIAGTVGIKNSNHITSVFRKKDGALIVTSTDGNIFTTRYPYRDLKKLDTPAITKFPETILSDSKGEYWLTHSFLLKINENSTSVLSHDQLATQNWSGTPPLYYALDEDQDGSLWILAETGLFGIKDNQFYAVSKEEKSGVMIESAMRQGGGMAIAPDGSVWAVFQKTVFRNGIPEFTLTEAGNTIFCDKEGSIWITNTRFGIQRYSRALIKHYLMEDEPSNYYGVYQDTNDRIWFGTWSKNLFYLTPDEKIRYVENSDDMGITATFGEGLNGGLYIGYIKCVRSYDKMGLKRLNFTRITDLPNEIFAMHTSADSSMWYGTRGGLYLLRSDSVHKVNDHDSIPDFPVRFILETSGQNLWMATNGSGVRLYNYRTAENRYFTKNDGLSSDNIRALLADKKGNIWVASEDRGLNRINRKTREINHIGKAQGLYSESLNGLLLDDYNRLWMSTNQGIFWVNMTQLEDVFNGKSSRVVSTVYTDRDGMISRETNGGFQNSTLKSKDGRLWFVTQEGLVCVDPSKIMATEPLPPVIIEDFMVDGKSVWKHNGAIDLDRATQNFTIKYTTPSYLAPNRIRFKYKLDGFDNKWIESGNRREAIYTNIPGWNYTFKVVAYYDQNAVETNFTKLSIHKQALIIETWWFWLLMVIGVILVIYLIFKWRLHQLKMQRAALEREVHDRTRELEAEQDITQAQKERLEVLDREKSRFFTNISHEFRTPLTLIISPLSELIGDPEIGKLAGNQQNRIGVSLDNARRLMRLVEQLLDIARLETGNLKLHLQPAPVNAYITDIADTFVGLEDVKNVHFEVEIPEEPVWINFDKEYFDKVIVNLLSNAFKYTSKGGTICLKMNVSDTELHIVVSDTGRGISPEHLPHLFNRFYQVEKSEMQPGTGIGLSILKEITELHNGKIDVESKRGEGSTFTVSFPLATEDELHAQKAESTAVASVGKSAEQKEHITGTLHFPGNEDGAEHDETDITSILMVDDNADIRTYVSDSLQKHYKILTAKSGNEAFQMVKEYLPDIIISDVMMPDGDGLQLLQRIRANKAYSFLPVVLLTAKAEIEHKLQGLMIGADDYITKPFDIQELKLRIHNILEARKRLKSAFLRKQDNAFKIELKPEQVDSQDAVFLESVKNAIAENFKEEQFTVESLAKIVNQSRSNLYRKLIHLTGESPSAMLKRIRLEHAAQLLNSNAGNVSEIAYSCGFNSVSHFSKSFSNAYGVSPTSFSQS